ncbi:MAG: redoxin domain-containing protein [Bacteroidales bacterium]|jgi:thiol-disulfide isomerase/thioredoxin|nr:redoxin domain-containing protein [Bacteroidales bacterium]
MKKYAIYIWFMLFGMCFAGTATAQYKIVVKIDGNKDTILLLGNYYLDKTYALDTAYPSKKGFVFERKDKPLPDGIYFFTNTAGKFCEFIIEKSRNFSMETDDSNWSRNMKVKGSDANIIYFDYLKSTSDLGDRVKALMKRRDSIGETEYNKQYQLLRNMNDSVKEHFTQTYPNHLLTKVLNCTKPVVIPPIEFKNDSNQYREEQFLWYKEHYFDNVDFSCGGLLRTPKGVFYDTYERYWNEVMKYEREDTILLYAEKVIAKCTDSTMFRFVVHNIAERYLKSSVMGQDKVYVEMIKRYYQTGKAWWMPPSATSQEVERATKWEKILLGKNVPNFACPDTNGVWHDVYSLKTKYKILVFWSPECGHCATEMPKIIKFYNDNKAKLNFEVLAICTEGSQEEWKKKIAQYKTTWIDVYGMESSMDWRDYFDIETTPQVFILNSDNAIIGKKISGDNLEGYLQAIDEGRFKP